MSRLEAVRANKNRPATIPEMAAEKFRAVKRIRAVPKAERLTNTQKLVERVRPMAIFAVEVLAMDKAELVRKAEDQDIFGPFLKDLHEAENAARTVLELISAAEARLAVALASVSEGEKAN